MFKNRQKYVTNCFSRSNFDITEKNFFLKEKKYIQLLGVHETKY